MGGELASKLWQHKDKCDVRREAGEEKSRRNQRPSLSTSFQLLSRSARTRRVPRLRFVGCRSNCLLNQSPGSCKTNDHDTWTQPKLFKHGAARCPPVFRSATATPKRSALIFADVRHSMPNRYRIFEAAVNRSNRAWLQPEGICIRPDSGTHTHTHTAVLISDITLRPLIKAQRL